MPLSPTRIQFVYNRTPYLPESTYGMCNTHLHQFQFKLHWYTRCQYNPRWNIGCVIRDTESFLVELATRIGLISADILVLTLIWMKTYRNYKNELKSACGLRPTAYFSVMVPETDYMSLSILTLSSGTMYFMSVLQMQLYRWCANSTAVPCSWWISLKSFWAFHCVFEFPLPDRLRLITV